MAKHAYNPIREAQQLRKPAIKALIFDEIKETIEPLVGAVNIDEERIAEANMWSTKKITHNEWQDQHNNSIFSAPVDIEIKSILVLNDNGTTRELPVAPGVKLEKPVILTDGCTGCDKAARLYMNPTNFDHTCDTYPAEGLVTHKNKSKDTTINGARKACKDCGLSCDRSDWRRREGYCSDCFKRHRDKALADKIAKLNEADVRIGPDRNKPEPPKETMNKLVSADYLLKRLQHNYPAKGEFLVEDAMKITEMSFRETLQLLQLLGDNHVKPISPGELKSQQKWKLVKQPKNET